VRAGLTLFLGQFEMPASAVLHSISSTFYKQFSCAKIPKAQKYSQAFCLICAFGICTHKRFAKNVDEIDTCYSDPHCCIVQDKCEGIQAEKEIVLQSVSRIKINVTR